MGQHEEDFSYDPAVQNQIYCIIQQNDMLHLTIICEVIPVFTFFYFTGSSLEVNQGTWMFSNDYKMSIFFSNVTKNWILITVI